MDEYNAIDGHNDFLLNMWAIQSKQDKNWIDVDKFNNDYGYRMKVVKQRILDISDQLHKLLNLFPWKDKVKNSGVKEIKQNILEQIIDIQKYLLGFADLLGFTPEKYFDEFVNKSEMIDMRLEQINNKIKYDDLILVLDMDGVICNYSKTYSKYLSEKLKIKDYNPDVYPVYRRLVYLNIMKKY